jgi:predicted ATP-grasp superfamily ATP-dependent carboligase
MGKIMNTKLILGALLCLSLTACAPDKDKDSTTANLTFTDVTDTSQCYGPSSFDIKLTSNKWQWVTRASNGATVIQTLEFNNGQLTLVARAFFKGESSSLRLQTTYSDYGSNQVYINGGGEASDEIRVGNEVFTFKINLTPTFLSYSFKGACLVGDTGDGPKTLLPY